MDPSALGHLMLMELPVGTHSYMLKAYLNCFTGTEAVRWMVSRGIARDNAHAVRLGNQMMEHGVFRHVMQEHTFKVRVFVGWLVGWWLPLTRVSLPCSEQAPLLSLHSAWWTRNNGLCAWGTGGSPRAALRHTCQDFQRTTIRRRSEPQQHSRRECARGCGAITSGDWRWW